MRRPTVAGQTGWAMILVVALALLVGALTTAGLVGSASRTETRASLAVQADQAAAILAAADNADIASTLLVLRRQVTPTAWRPGADPVRGDPLARAAYAQIGSPQPTDSASFETTVDGDTVFLELRPIRGARTLIMAKELTTFGPAGMFLRRMLLGLAVGIAVAALAAWLLSRRIAHPLRAVVAVAGRLAAGERDLYVPINGPREVAEVGDSVNALVTSLSRSERRQQEFLMSISHELRTPLTAIRGFGEAVEDGVTDGLAARRAGAVVVAEATRLERLVADLLELARVGAADFRVDLVPVDLRELMAAAADVWRERARATGLVFTAELPDAPIIVSTDAVRLRQVLDALAENALRVTPEGEPLVLALRAEPGVAVIEVRDGGPGLTAEDRDVAFERGALHDRYRGERKVGTGLGLALVKALVTGLGGQVSVGPAVVEKGTAFTVRLPTSTEPDQSGTG